MGQSEHMAAELVAKRELREKNLSWGWAGVSFCYTAEWGSVHNGVIAD